MKPRPQVLITPCSERKGAEFLDRSLSLSEQYPRAIVAAGGLPWVLPCLPSEELAAGGQSGGRPARFVGAAADPGGVPAAKAAVGDLPGPADSQCGVGGRVDRGHPGAIARGPEPLPAGSEG